LKDYIVANRSPYNKIDSLTNAITTQLQQEEHWRDSWLFQDQQRAQVKLSRSIVRVRVRIRIRVRVRVRVIVRVRIRVRNSVLS
jgi:hypothetical protein